MIERHTQTHRLLSYYIPIFNIIIFIVFVIKTNIVSALINICNYASITIDIIARTIITKL